MLEVTTKKCKNYLGSFLCTVAKIQNVLILLKREKTNPWPSKALWNTSSFFHSLEWLWARVFISKHNSWQYSVQDLVMNNHTDLLRHEEINFKNLLGTVSTIRFLVILFLKKPNAALCVYCIQKNFLSMKVKIIWSSSYQHVTAQLRRNFVLRKFQVVSQYICLTYLPF